MKKLFSPKLWNFLFACYLIVVLVGLTIPTQDKVDLNQYLFGIRTDHYVHALLFVPFMVCQYFGKRLTFAPAIAQGYTFAIACEFLHYFIPYRTFDVYDIVSNCIGMTIGGTFYLVAKRIAAR